MSAKKSPLDRLAKAHHIEPGYDDIWQKRHETSAETQQALLQAMGVPADSDRAIAQSLDAFAAEAVARLAPGILVQCEGEPLELSLTVEAGTAGRVYWAFRREDGVEETGEAGVGDLEVTERITVHGTPFLRRTLPLPIKPPQAITAARFS